ncbi:MAG: alpha-glucosidase C-terminal domain-containing protein [Prolixibacteraceae bacterium]|nr:alpha-glucosidase C-terminal domain-containing protein [Prolixibacteraceae bacterium]
MNKFKNLFIIPLLALALFACQPAVKTNPVTTGIPEWTKNSVLYEVNIRQYTPEGTFKAFELHLPRLKELGVDILWIMPIHPISEKNRKGSLGSYYAVKDYKGINPEFGTLEDFKSLVNKAHEMGFKVIIDWVANHTGWDNQWITDHPEWYTKDSLGNIVPPNPDWSDIADLNFDSQPMRRTMIDAMDYWVKETNIDGFRCDVAWGVPQDFWEAATASLDSIKQVYMLAEDEDHPALLEKAFESNYAWKLHHILNEVAQGKKTAADIQKYYTDSVNKYAPGAFPMQFITNHDENSWQGTEYERMGEAVKTFAALTFTIEGIPLLYSGQEAGLNKRLLFFEKDTINWSNLEMQKYYQSLISLKKSNEALWNGTAGAPMVFVETSAPRQVLAFTREKDKNQVLAVFNLSAQPVEATIQLPQAGDYQEYFSGETTTLEKGSTIKLDKWGYQVFVRK